MALLEDNQADQCIAARFEQTLIRLLEAHRAYQKQIIQLTEDNKRLKALLETPNTNLTTTANHQPITNDLVRQINKYIKEIDLCLAYFEQV